jgi:inosine-uridine nucleoside N-ribohydrolase
VDDRPRLLLDCDPGLDDAVAIALALRHGDVVGITTVGGNVGLDRTTANALAICELLGRADVPVHAGHDLPMRGDAPVRATHVHGQSGLGDARLPVAARAADSDDAVGFIIESVRAEEGVWLVPTGPLTNVAHALAAAPDLVDKVAGICWMGGSATRGNATAAAEFNALADPEAAAAVFAAGVPDLIMVGLTVTETVTVAHELLDQLRQAATAVSLAYLDMLAGIVDRAITSWNRPGAAMHDALAVLRVTHPSLFSGVRRHVVVECAGEHTRGMTLVDHRPSGSAATNCEVVEWADADRIRTLVTEVLTT